MSTSDYVTQVRVTSDGFINVSDLVSYICKVRPLEVDRVLTTLPCEYLQKHIMSRQKDSGIELFISVKNINTFIVMLPSEMPLQKRLSCVRHLVDFRASQLAQGLIIPPIEYADEVPSVPYAAMLNSPEPVPKTGEGMSVDEFLRLAEHPAPDLDETGLKSVATFALEAEQTLNGRQLREVNIRVARVYRQMHGVEPLKARDFPPQRVYVYGEASRDMILDEIDYVLLRDGL